jgi:hypothetical protein
VAWFNLFNRPSVRFFLTSLVIYGEEIDRLLTDTALIDAAITVKLELQLELVSPIWPSGQQKKELVPSVVDHSDQDSSAQKGVVISSSQQFDPYNTKTY